MYHSAIMLLKVKLSLPAFWLVSMPSERPISGTPAIAGA
jgi:hypothetical protein